MPRKKTFMLVSLQEDKAKQLAQIISNDTSRKILDYLSEKEATETELAKELKLPISTIHYNLKQLVKGSLVETKKFHYSEKGKEVLHYSLANKYIIIAPKSTFGLKEKLRSILPVGIIALGTAALLQGFQKHFPKVTRTFSSGAPAQGAGMIADVAVDTAPLAAEETLKSSAVEGAVESIRLTLTEGVSGVLPETTNLYATAAEDADMIAVQGLNWTAQESVNWTTQEAINRTILITQEPSMWSSPALWFLIGAVTAIGLYLLFSYIFRKK